jgi:hypothetical protein
VQITISYGAMGVPITVVKNVSISNKESIWN